MTAFIRYLPYRPITGDNHSGATGAPKEVQVLLEKLQMLIDWEQAIVNKSFGEAYLDAHSKARAYNKVAGLIERTFIKHPSRLRPFPKKRNGGKRP